MRCVIKAKHVLLLHVNSLDFVLTNCTRAEAKIERINTVARHVLLQNFVKITLYDIVLERKAIFDQIYYLQKSAGEIDPIYWNGVVL